MSESGSTESGVNFPVGGFVPDELLHCGIQSCHREDKHRSQQVLLFIGGGAASTSPSLVEEAEESRGGLNRVRERDLSARHLAGRDYEFDGFDTSIAERH